MTQGEYWKCLFEGVSRVGKALMMLFVVSLVLWVGGLYIGNQGELARGLFFIVIAAWVGLSALAGAAMIPVWVLVRANRRCRK